MKWQVVETKKGTRCRVLEGGSGAPVVFFHGAGGLLADNPFLDGLAARYHVFAPELPGYGESTGEELLEDMLDFTLHGWDVVGALGLTRPHLVGHSMGGMIAAEMACLAPRDLGKLVLASAAGLWMDEHPIPDVFALLPFELVEEGILGEEAACPMQEDQGRPVPTLEHATAGAAAGLDHPRVHRGFSAPGRVSSGRRRSSMGWIHQRSSCFQSGQRSRRRGMTRSAKSRDE